MTSLARRFIFRDLKKINRQRQFCVSASLKKEEYVVKSPHGELVIPNVRFINHLWRFSSGFDNFVAVQCAETNISYTYKQLFKLIAVFGTSLRKNLGLKEKDVVFVMLPNVPEYVVVALGTIQAGCVLSVTNPLYKEFEISHQLRITSPKVIVTIPECYDVAVKGLQKAKIDAKIVIIDRDNTPIPSNTNRFSELAEKGEADYKLLDSIETKPDDTLLIPFSSGTTGLPKGVEITNKNLVSALEVMNAEEIKYAILNNGDHQDVVPCILPFFHIYGFVVNMLAHLRNGCKLVTIPKFTVNSFFDVLKNEKVSLLYLVPPIAILLGKHPDVKQEYFQHLRHVVCGAAPLSASDVEAVLQKSKKDIEFHQGWGATETSSMGTTIPKRTKILDYNSCGLASRTIELKFLDTATGKPVPIGQPGEVLIRGSVVMKGYHKNEAATKDSFTDDGFFKTGDLGYYKQDTGLYITERIKELIKVKGSQVAPAELESILRLHPSVVEAAVIGIPHQFYGEVPKAFVIQKPGSKISEEEIIQFVSNQVADYKRIEEVKFVTDIPKTASGKILKRELKKLYA